MKKKFMILSTTFRTIVPIHLVHFFVQLGSKAILFKLIFLLLLIITIPSFAQTQINYAPTISGFTYTNEKVFAADVNADTHQDIITYNAGSGTVSALLHNGNNNVNTMQFSNTYSITVSPDVLIDVKCINTQDTKSDLISYAAGVTYTDFYYYQSNGNSFSSAATLTSNLLNGTYQYGTFDINNDGAFEIYALDKVNAILFYGTIDLNNYQVNFSSVSSLPSITANSIVHIFNGHFQSANLNDLCYVSENAGANNQSAFTAQVLKNTGGTSLTADFSSNYNGSSNQLFYAGKFTTDNFSDIAIYPADGEIFVLPNAAGTAFGSIASWQNQLTTPPAAYFILDAGNYSTNNAYVDILLLETVANAVPANLGNSYTEVNAGNNAGFNLMQLGVAPCNANPIAVGSLDYHIIQADFDQLGPADIVLYNPSNGILQVGIVLENIATTFVRGYCWPQSAAQGDQINFYISGTTSSGTLEIYHYESRDATVIPTLLMSTALPNGIAVQNFNNNNIVANGCGWNSTYTLTIPNNGSWPPGYYAAKITNNYCNEASINFIVKSDGSQSTKKLLLLANTNTWAAYNTFSDGAQPGSKYGNGNISIYQNYSFMRPESNNNIESGYNTGGVRAELWIYTWLKDNGYDPDLITDLDLHLISNNLLNSYDYLVMGTHPEYWTEQMYDKVKDFQQNGGSNSGNNGGNLICLGGNAVFEIVDIDLTNVANPKLIAYPNNANTQQNGQYPLAGMPEVGGQPFSSPTPINNIPTFDRFDYFLERYNFGTMNSPVHKRSIDLIGTHYQNLAAYDPNGGNTNASYTQSPNFSSPLFNGIGNSIWGNNGYSDHYGVVGGSGKAAGWECDRYTPADPPTALSPITPSSPATTASVYDNDIQILASSTPNTYSVPSYDAGINLYFPNGMNNSEIIYVPPQCAAPKRGFVFTAGSICFGGSLVWNYDGQNNVYNNDLSRLLINVLNQSHFNLKLEATNLDCQGGGGSIQATGSSCTTMTYQLQPGNVPNNNTGFFAINSAGIYTITATDVNANTVSKTIELIDPSSGNFCCSASAETMLTIPGVILQIAPNASDLLAQYSNGANTISNKTFYIDDVLNVDADITFRNCILWFTPTGSVQLQGPYKLTINTSTLQASCDWWGGIVANTPLQKVSMNGSTLKSSGIGLHVLNNALIEINDCDFVDNGENDIYMSDMTLNPYPGFITASTFSSQNNLQGNLWFKTQKAIELNNVKHLNIGNLGNLSSRNSFSGMYTGILITNLTNTSNSNIGIYNNTFSYINAAGNDEYGKMVNCYTDAKGAAIFCKADANPNSNCHLFVENTLNNTTPYFSGCDKAIVSLGNQLDAKHLRIYNCLLGIMSNCIYNRDYTIDDNEIYNTHLGIHLTGNQPNVSVNSNRIYAYRTINEVDNNQQIVNTYAPIGIKFQMNISWIGATVNQLIADNTVTINRIAGVGFFNSNAGSVFEEKGNSVLFNTNSTADPTNYNITSLMGYYNENNYKARYIQNTTVGPGGNQQVWLARTSISMFMNHSKHCKLDCNRLKYTRFGFFVWGDNTTGVNNVTHNKCNANAIPWFFLDGPATKGTFGNVGNGTTDDNDNEYISTTNPVDWRAMIPAINTVYKVFRLSSGTFSDYIFTTPSLLDVPEIGPLGSGWEYLFQQNVIGYTDPCAEDDDNLPEYIAEPDIDSNEYNSAMAVAQDSMTYINFPTVGSWIDKYKLYLEQDTDSLLLNSKPELLYFYNTTSTQTIGDIKNAADKIALLYDTTTNAGNDSLRYASAVAANTLISSANDWETNEKKVNNVLLFMYNHSFDSIPLYMKEDMQYLAGSCPFVEGTSVYRARTIYSLWEPNAIFDDRILCIQGQNKNQDNSNMNIDSLIESQIAAANMKIVNTPLYISTNITKKLGNTMVSEIKIFPNPASTFIIVEYNCESDGELILMNSQGQEILKTTLERGRKKVQIQIGDIAIGMYQYKCKFDNCTEKIAKLTFQK